MASKAPVRSLHILSRTSRSCCRCADSSAPSLSSTLRQFSTTPLRSEETSERPRWSYTPPQMKAPFHPRIKNPAKAWQCNDDPQKVDDMYIRFLGRGGEKVLTEEIKWLALTHKSYDQGRRGFNDRLAFFGKRIIILQTTLSLLNTPYVPKSSEPNTDVYSRVPFEHPALANLPNLSSIKVNDFLTKERVGQVANSYGIPEVTRWKPKNPGNLQGSGSDVVFSTSLYAIIGAIALQKGGETANDIVRTRILTQLGVL